MKNPLFDRKNTGKYVAATILLIGLVLTGSTRAAEFDPFGTDTDVLSVNEYYTNRGAPGVKLKRYCPEDGDCRKRIVNQNGRLLKEFSSEKTVSALGRSRYWDRIYLLVRHSYERGDNSGWEVKLFDQNGDYQNVDQTWKKAEALDIFPTFKGNLAVLQPDGLHIWTTGGRLIHQVEVSESLTHGRIQANLDGTLATIGVSSNNTVWLGDAESWTKTNLTLTRRGDRRGIFTAYPIPDDGTAGVVYDYENVYRKGLYMVRSEGDTGPVFLSSDRNVGWDPELLITDSEYLISAKDSTHERPVQVSVPRQELNDREWPNPDLEKFPEGGNNVSMFAGVGVMSRHWRAESKVKKNGTIFTNVDYNFNRALLRKAQFQGRIGSTRYVLNYLKQLTEEKIEKKAGRTASESVEYLTGMIEFENYISPSSSLRLGYRRSKTEGLASITHSTKPDTSESFNVKFQEFGLYQMLERGRYYGLEYTNYQLPSAVGFSNQNQNIVYSDFDSEFGFQTLSFIAGYDPQSYAKRYETNYSGWFVSGDGGLGLGWAEISDRIKREAKSTTGKDEISIPLFLALEATIETGYLWQRRTRFLGGLGLQTLLGYRADATWMAVGRNDENDDVDQLVLEFDREDIWHGPFVRFNIIF